MKKVAVVILMLSLATEIAACAWTYLTTLEGKVVSRNALSDAGRIKSAMQKPGRKSEWLARAQALENTWQTADYKTQSDYAVALMHTGRAKEAVSILERLAAKFPEEYIIVANLGTAYELAGELEQALEWITRGIEINENSHFGTEWLHVRILEAKMELAKDANWLQANSVLQIDFGNQSVPKRPVDLNDETKRKYLEDALMYQLHERVQFVAPPDPIVADLLFDWGNLHAVYKDLEGALRFYDLSLVFGELREPLINERKEKFKWIIWRKAPLRFWYKHTESLPFTAFAVALLVLGGLALKRCLRKKPRSSA